MIRHIRLDKHAPRHSAAVTYELDPPFRSAVVTILRIFGSFGFMFGIWEPHPDQYDDELVDAHLFNALNAKKNLVVVPPLRGVEFSEELFDEEELQKDTVMYMVPLRRSLLDAQMEASVRGPHSPEYLEELKEIYERQVVDE
jgi:hypothetical protein